MARAGTGEADIANNFTTARSGLPGNDDAGQTSSRLVFDMLGLYPVNPLSNSYEIGSPVFDSATLSLDQGFYPGTQFVIQANSNTALNKYVQSALVNSAGVYRQGGWQAFNVKETPYTADQVRKERELYMQR